MASDASLSTTSMGGIITFNSPGPAEIPQLEWPQTKIGPEFHKVFPARLPAGGILRPALRFHTKLAADSPDHDIADLHSHLQTPARKPQ
jgi:hypothetical protein